jgi:hypothetical protein
MSNHLIRAAEELYKIAYSLQGQGDIEKSIGQQRKPGTMAEEKPEAVDVGKAMPNPEDAQKYTGMDYDEMLDWWNSKDGKNPKIQGEGMEEAPESYEKVLQAARSLNEKYEYPSSAKSVLKNKYKKSSIVRKSSVKKLNKKQG